MIEGSALNVDPAELSYLQGELHAREMRLGELEQSFLRLTSVYNGLEMAFQGETWTLDRFIETTVALDNQHRIREPSPEPAPEGSSPTQKKTDPLQLGHGRLQCLQKQLCLYCGEYGHLRLQCPVLPETKVSGTLCCNHLTVPIMLLWGSGQVKTQAMVDSGAAGCFMDSGFARAHSIPIKPTEALDGQPLGRGYVDYQTAPVTVSVGVCHQETLQFYLIASPEFPLILVFLWLSHHDPVFHWSTGELVAWRTQCEMTCLRLPC
ncbi:hypothetical protein Z043_125796 [Scleropages formosus]|uniref:CCHC-type domain-containing protein n=1 Tax=Scleropages formosus TaxID=113540 RepID=A0A0P7W1T4_SCLFO|nr:hypothetical protein Z043_125796 [Scleropages formosus]